MLARHPVGQRILQDGLLCRLPVALQTRQTIQYNQVKLFAHDDIVGFFEETPQTF